MSGLHLENAFLFSIDLGLRFLNLVYIYFVLDVVIINLAGKERIKISWEFMLLAVIFLVFISSEAIMVDLYMTADHHAYMILASDTWFLSFMCG